MFFWILLVFCIFVTGWTTYCFVFDDYMFESVVTRIIATPVAFLVIGFCAVFFAGCIYVPLAYVADDYSHESGESTQELHAINMGEGISGQFFLGSGYINEESTYTFFYRNENGNLQSDRIEADYAEIVEDNSETPRIVTHSWDMPWWYGPMDMEETYTIYIPENSIKPVVDMDLPD